MKKFTVLLLGASLLPGIVAAADLDDVTMEVVEGESSETINKRIQLPEAASDTARNRAERGLEQANQVREHNRERQRIRVEEGTGAMREYQEQQQELREQRREMQQEQRELSNEQRGSGGNGPR